MRQPETFTAEVAAIGLFEYHLSFESDDSHRCIKKKDIPGHADGAPDRSIWRRGSEIRGFDNNCALSSCQCISLALEAIREVPTA